MVLSVHSGIKKTVGRRRSGSPKKRLSRSSLGNDRSTDLSKDSNSNVKVVVRVRPQNERELERGQSSVIKVLDEHMLIFDPKEEANDFYFHGKKQRGRDLLKKEKKDLKLAFDRVFDGNSTNEEVFQATTNSVVDGLLKGYNCSGLFIQIVCFFSCTETVIISLNSFICKQYLHTEPPVQARRLRCWAMLKHPA